MARFRLNFLVSTACAILFACCFVGFAAYAFADEPEAAAASSALLEEPGSGEGAPAPESKPEASGETSAEGQAAGEEKAAGEGQAAGEGNTAGEDQDLEEGLAASEDQGPAFAIARDTASLPEAAVGWVRVWGQDAYDTMQQVVRADGVFAAGRGGTVIVATGEAYWDALAAAGLAGIYNAPVVTTPGVALGKQAKEEIERLAPAQVLVMGGPLAISDTALGQLKALCPNVSRVYGQTAPDTALAIYEAGKALTDKTADGESLGWGKTAIVATSNGYWDALSIAPYAFARQAPIFLTNDSARAAGRTLSAEALASLKAGGFERVVIVGGELAVAPSVETQLSQSGIAKIERLWGQTALDTSGKIAQWELREGMNLEHLTVATDSGYWDALAGAAYVGSYDSVLVLVDNYGNYQAFDAVYDYAQPEAVPCGRVLGGELAVCRRAYERITAPWVLDSLALSVVQQADGSWIATATAQQANNQVPALEYRYTWIRDATGEQGVLRTGGSDPALAFGEAAFNFVAGTYTLSAEALSEGAVVGAASASVRVDGMTARAQGYSSRTNQLILVDCTNNWTSVFTGSKGNWQRVKFSVVSTGAPTMPTVKGSFTVTGKGYSFGTEYTCYYYTQFWGDYLFHSILFDPGTFNVQDGRLGESISHGCVRMALEDAKWIYDNIAYGTAVIVY